MTTSSKIRRLLHDAPALERHLLGQENTEQFVAVVMETVDGFLRTGRIDELIAKLETQITKMRRQGYCAEHLLDRALWRVAFDCVIEELAAQGLVKDSGERRNGEIVWVRT